MVLGAICRNVTSTLEVIIKHVYIERRMIPLNIYLQEAFDAGGANAADQSPPAVRAREQIERGVVEYGNAIKDLVSANIFPGDMLWKNFGITHITALNGGTLPSICLTQEQ